MPAPPCGVFPGLFDGQVSCQAPMLARPRNGQWREEASRLVVHRPPFNEGIDHHQPIVSKTLSRRSEANVLVPWAMTGQPTSPARVGTAHILREDETKDRSRG